MKDFKLDLTKFKHVSSDKNSSTLKHYEGHTITIAHKALSKMHKDALLAMAHKADSKALAEGDGKPSTKEMMADGGSVKTNPSEMSLSNLVSGVKDLVTPQPVAKPAPKDPGPISGKYGSSKYAEGGRIMMAEGESVPAALAPNSPDNTTPETGNMNFGLPDLSQQGIQDTTDVSSPAAKFDYYKKANMNMSDQDIFNQIAKEDASKSMDATQRSTDDQAKTAQLAQMAVQKQAAGIALSPAEASVMSAATGQMPYNPDPNPGMAPDPGVAAAAKQMTQGSNAQSGMNVNDTEGMMASGFNKQMSGINAQATALGNLGADQAKIIDEQVQAQNTAKAKFQESFGALDRERQGFVKDIQEGHIDPEKYWTGDKDGNGGHSKIAAGIGMILAGFNPTNSPNAAINFIKYQMDRNIEAQKQNLSSKQTLLSENLRQFGNLRDATEMTRIQQNDIMAHQLQSAAATAQSPMAKAAALQASGKLQADMAPQFQQFAMRRAMMGMANGGAQDPKAIEQMLGYMRMVNPEMAKEMQTRYVPGIGLGTVLVPDAVRANLIAHQDVDRTLQQTLLFAKNNSNSLDPRVRAQGATLMNELQSKIRTAESQGVYKESEAAFMNKTLGSNPAEFLSAYTTVPKLKQMLQIKHQEYQNLGRGYGLNIPGVQQSAEPQYKTVNGVKYTRGADGKPVKVK